MTINARTMRAQSPSLTPKGPARDFVPVRLRALSGDPVWHQSAAFYAGSVKGVTREGAVPRLGPAIGEERVGFPTPAPLSWMHQMLRQEAR